MSESTATQNQAAEQAPASEPKTHAIDMSALSRDNQKLSLDKEEMCLKVDDLSLFYGEKQALHNIQLEIPKKRVTAFIGPSGCGKSTLLRCFKPHE